MKTLNDFKQEVADKYGFKTWEALTDEIWCFEKHLTELIELYAEYREERVADLFLKPLAELRPLEDLWRSENPHKYGKYIVPDAIIFYKWIVFKIGSQLSESVKLQKEAHKQGWNEALQWAVNQLDSGDIHFIMTPNEQRLSILKGLKP